MTKDTHEIVHAIDEPGCPICEMYPTVHTLAECERMEPHEHTHMNVEEKS